jgi:hypothetical protein
METRTFLATVPIPKQPAPESRENDIPKELKEALFSYSTAYDDWVNAKGLLYLSFLFLCCRAHLIIPWSKLDYSRLHFFPSRG